MQNHSGARDIQDKSFQIFGFSCLQDLVHVSNAQLFAYSNFKKKKEAPTTSPNPIVLSSYTLWPHLTQEANV